MVEESCEDNLRFSGNKSECNEISNRNNEFQNDSDNDAEPVVVTKKRIVAFSDSDSDRDADNKNTLKSVSPKHTLVSSSDETCNSSEHKKYESLRTENKKNRLKDKFKKLKAPLNKKIVVQAEHSDNNSEAENEESDEEISCLKIKEVCNLPITKFLFKVAIYQSLTTN